MRNRPTFKPMGFKNKENPVLEREKQLERYKEEVAKYKGKEEFQPVFDRFFENGTKNKKIGQGNQGIVYKVGILAGLLERDIRGNLGFQDSL